MADDVELQRFAETLRQEVITRAEIEEEEGFRENVLTQIVVDYLIESGEVEDGQPCFHQAWGMRVNGYHVTDDGDELDLFVTIYTDSVLPETVPRADVDSAFRRLQSFLDHALGDYYLDLEEASPVFDMAQRIHEVRECLERVRLYLITDGITTVDERQPLTDGGFKVISYHIWDLRRLFRYVSSGQAREPITIDFAAQYGSPVPCLAVPAANPDYHAYLAILPGELLAKLYDEYGDRLLERNVRSFLQARGKINKGIRNTALKEPHRFLAYNNGISGTAAAIELVDTAGGKAIRSLRDFQIVNGGQTTASIYQARRRDGADVSAVFVQAKISVVDPARIEEIVPLISRYANSQNKVSEPDFSANDPFHIRLEELSRTVWVPAALGSQRQTHWFYERARGQYLVARGREGTPGRQKVFVALNPTAQKFTKTDLAKFENTWDQLPHVVSRGAEKNFREFTIRLKNRGPVEVDQTYFERLVARAVLFRTTERIVHALAFGGYRANIVTYTIAYLSHVSAQRIDLGRIWRDQDLSPALREAIALAARDVHGLLMSPPAGGNITEWCKKEECWRRVQSLKAVLPESFWAELLPEASPYGTNATRSEGADPDHVSNVVAVMGLPAERWFAIAAWAKQTSNLQPWQRALAFSLGRLVARGKEPSPKQAVQGVKILNAARELGFKLDGNDLADTARRLGAATGRSAEDVRSATAPAKSRYATKRMSTRVEDGHLIVTFEDGIAGRWVLPGQTDKEGIWAVREAAVQFALENGASDPGQTNAVRKALTDAGYYLTR